MNREQPFSQNISAVLISPPKAPSDSQWTPTDGMFCPAGPPTIISRAEWGADETMRCGGPLYDKGIRAAVIHHTAGSNDYLPQESAGIVKAIYIGKPQGPPLPDWPAQLGSAGRGSG